MNYDMTVEVSFRDKCLGAFEVTVWDQFGDLEVTNWGEQISCSDQVEREEDNNF